MSFVQSIDEIIGNFEKLKSLEPEIMAIADVWVKALENKKKILFCGNGGSASDAQHLAAELIGRYKLNRPALAGLCLNTDTSALTAIGNDFGFDTIYARQVEGLAEEGDVLVGISTSGNSANIVKAFEMAKSRGVLCVAFTGEHGGTMRELADYGLFVPSNITNNIQEMHIACGHILCDYTEKYFFAKEK